MPTRVAEKGRSKPRWPRGTIASQGLASGLNSAIIPRTEDCHAIIRSVVAATDPANCLGRKPRSGSVGNRELHSLEPQLP
jgi:hypothetical protein